MKKIFYSMLLMVAIFAGTQLVSLSSAHAQDVWFASESYFDWYYHDDTIRYSTRDNDGYFCNASVGIVAVEKEPATKELLERFTLQIKLAMVIGGINL